MTESTLAVAATPTRLATSLAAKLAAQPDSQLVQYRGVLTPSRLDAPEREKETLVSGAAIHDLGWLRRIAVRGEDRFRWLSGMVTNIVNDLAVHAGAWNLVLNAQGRIQGDLTVWREEEALELVMTADQQEKLLAHFDHFIIMDDVELLLLSEETALGLTGPLAADVLGRLGLPALVEEMTASRVEWNGFQIRLQRGYGVLAPHYELWADPPAIPVLWQALHTAGATAVGCDSLEALRIAEGVPAYGIDMMERDLPQETSQMRALHFNKGCYLGQEIVERIRSRGNVHRHLRQLEIFGALPQTGTVLTQQDGTAAGEIRSAAAFGSRIFALGMIAAAAEVRNQPLAYDAGTANLLATAPRLT